MLGKCHFVTKMEERQTINFLPPEYIAHRYNLIFQRLYIAVLLAEIIFSYNNIVSIKFNLQWVLSNKNHSDNSSASDKLKLYISSFSLSSH